jgi:hypothetical protein
MTTSVFAKPEACRSTDTLRLERRPDGRLWAIRGDQESPVGVRRCFPWSDAGRFLSLRDGEDEFALVGHPSDLDPHSRRLLEEGLAEAGFVFRVTRVLEIEEEVEIRHWRVDTAQGTRSFQTRLDDWPRQLPHRGLLVRDVAGDLYLLAAPEEMDRKSRELLWALVD